MIDLAISNSGDIAMSEKLTAPELKLSWRIGDYESLILSFIIGRNMIDPEENTGLELFFTIGKEEDKKQCDIAHDIENIRQQVMMLLRTPREELPLSKEYGSDLYLLKHKDITSESVVDKVKEIVTEISSRYIKNPKILVKRTPTDSAFSSQNLNVYIYDKNVEIYNFNMEVI